LKKNKLLEELVAGPTTYSLAALMMETASL
jgi:hypothetical protein